jgi:hypothetical protein
MLNEVKHLLFPSYQKKQKQILRLRLRMTLRRSLGVGEIDA